MQITITITLKTRPDAEVRTKAQQQRAALYAAIASVSEEHKAALNDVLNLVDPILAEYERLCAE